MRAGDRVKRQTRMLGRITSGCVVAAPMLGLRKTAQDKPARLGSGSSTNCMQAGLFCEGSEAPTP